MKDLVKRLKRNLYLRNACEYGEKAPTETYFTQMKQIEVEGFRMIEAWLRREALKTRASQPLMGARAGNLLALSNPFLGQRLVDQTLNSSRRWVGGAVNPYSREQSINNLIVLRTMQTSENSKYKYNENIII